MNAQRILPALLSALSMLAACRNTADDGAARIPVLEQELSAGYSQPKADSLIGLYRESVKNHPDDYEANIRALTRVAEILYFQRQDAVGAVRALDEAINKNGKESNLTEPMGLLTRIWSAYNYKSGPTVMLHPDDIDQMAGNLMHRKSWIDSSLARLDLAMGSVATTNRAKAEIFVETAEGYAALLQRSDPEKATDLLMKAAGVAKNIGSFNKAIQLYFTVSDKMQPPTSKAPTALFMQGFVYENDLADLENAKARYQEFLKRYPKDEFADDAQQALNMLGKSPEDIIREFEKKNPPKKQ